MNIDLQRLEGKLNRLEDLLRKHNNRLLSLEGGTITLDASTISSGLGYRPSNIGFAYPGDYDPTFMVFATLLVRPTNRVLGEPITWQTIAYNSAHAASFFDSAEGINGSDTLRINYPQIKNIFFMTAVPDESFSLDNITLGATVGDTYADFQVVRPRIGGVQLIGNGSGWNVSYDAFDALQFSSFSGVTGITQIRYLDTSSIRNRMPSHPLIVYQGSNGYTIEQVTPTGDYFAAFKMRDSAGNVVTTSPTSGDRLHISGPIQRDVINCYDWTEYNWWMGAGFFNFLVLGIFEVWLTASAKSSTSILVRWQDGFTDFGFPNYQNLKLYRSTSSDMSGKTLVYSGANLSFEDTGLSADTTYYYQLTGEVASVETEVTRYNARTLKV